LQCGQSWRELVVHHFGARFVADVCGLSDELRRYRFQEDGVSDALAYADQRIGPDGSRVPLPQRIAEVLDRHTVRTRRTRGRAAAGNRICVRAAARVEQRLTGRTGRDL